MRPEAKAATRQRTAAGKMKEKKEKREMRFDETALRQGCPLARVHK